MTSRSPTAWFEITNRGPPVAAELKKAFGIDAEMTKGSGGVFDVVAHGNLVYSKRTRDVSRSRVRRRDLLGARGPDAGHAGPEPSVEDLLDLLVPAVEKVHRGPIASAFSDKRPRRRPPWRADPSPRRTPPPSPSAAPEAPLPRAAPSSPSAPSPTATRLRERRGRAVDG